MPYCVQLEGRYQGIHFGEHPPGLEDLRTVSQRRLRDALRFARREEELDGKPNVVQQALHYADILARNPELTKAQLARELGVSRIRVYQALNILKLSPAILRFILAHDTPESRAVLTERRLRSLTAIRDHTRQLEEFRHLVRALSPRQGRPSLASLGPDSET